MLINPMETKSRRSRIEELKRRRLERQLKRPKPEKNFLKKIDEITRPRMGPDAAPEASVALQLDTYSLKEYFRHKKVNRVVKKNQAVQTSKELETAMIQRYSMAKRRHGSVSVTDRRQNKTIMNMLGNFARQASISKTRESSNSGNLLGGMKGSGPSLLGRLGGAGAGANPFLGGGAKLPNGGLYQTAEVQEEYQSGSGSFYSDENASVMSDDAFNKRKKAKNLGFREMSPKRALGVIRSERFKEYFLESSRYLEKVG